MRLVFIILAVLLPAQVSQAQVLRVRVTANGAEPIQGAGVFLLRAAEQSALRMLSSDLQGLAVFTGLEPGPYIVRAEIIGSEMAEARVTVIADSVATVELRLRPAPIILDSVTARGERARARFQQDAGATVRELTREELKRIPGLAEADVMRAVEALPGVVSTSDFSSSFNVRGGSADQNLILLDGIPIYNPFHLGGVFSVFNSDMVDRAELLAGGFPAQYGGRVSSVLNVISDPGAAEFDVRAGISLLATRISAAARIPAINDAQIRVGVRRSYFDQLLKPFLDFPYHLADAQMAGEVWAGPRDRFGVTAYIGEDVLKLAGSDSFPLKVDWQWGNRIVGARWTRTLDRGGLLSARASHSYFSTDMTFPEFGDTYLASRINHALVRFDGAWPVGRHELRAGVEANRLRYDNLAESGGTVFGGGNEVGWAHGAYAQTAWRASPALLIETGLRADAWLTEGDGEVLLSPRLAIKRFVANGSAAFKLAGGRYTQFIHSLRDEELPIGLDVWVLSGSRAPKVRSDQLQLGAEWFGADWYTAVESYWRRFRGIATNNFAQDPNDPLDDLLAGDGLSYGADVIVRKERGRVTGFATVSWLKAEREFPDFLTGEETPPLISYPPLFDRRVEVELVLRVPLFRQWEGGLRWNLGSGLPYTRPVGGYLMYDYHFDRARRNLGAAPDSALIAVLLGERNAERYPMYHRLDVSMRRTFNKRWGTLTPHLDILNVYNRKNVLFYFFEYEKSTPVRSGVSMFPFLPTVGVEVTF